MKYTDSEIKNAKTGQIIRFICTDADVLEMEAMYPSGSKEPPVHYHPDQDEHFEILSGEMTVRLNGDVRLYGKGDVIDIKKGDSHSMWNEGAEKAEVSWRVSPAMETEHFLRTMTRLANSPLGSHNGLPEPMTMIYLLNHYRSVIRLVKPSYGLIRCLGVLLFPVMVLKKRKVRLIR